jgi:hypothetical protein
MVNQADRSRLEAYIYASSANIVSYTLATSQGMPRDSERGLAPQGDAL